MPSFSERKHQKTAPSAFACALSSTMEIQDLRDRAFVGNEAKLITGDAVRDLMQKGKRESQRVMIVKRREATRKQFGYGSTLGKWQNLVSVSVFQHENPLDLDLFGRGETRLSVPGSSMHPNLVRFPAQDDPVVTQNLRFSQRAPQTRSRTLSCTRMAQK